MSADKRITEKIRLHPRNKNRENYDLESLILIDPELKDHIKKNKYGENSVNFSDPKAVKILNKAILHHYYGVES